MSKIIEKMVSHIWYLEKHNLLSLHKHGFQKNRSNNDNIYWSTYTLTSVMTSVNKQNIILISLNPKKSIQKLYLHGNMLKFINNHIHDRIFQVKIKNILSETFSNQNSVILQGS